MDVEHENGDLERLEFDAGFNAGLGQPLVKKFRWLMGIIRAANDERDFYALKSLHFEKLAGRPGERSMRLNKQWRLIVVLQGRARHKKVVVRGIEDYH